MRALCGVRGGSIHDGDDRYDRYDRDVGYDGYGGDDRYDGYRRDRRTDDGGVADSGARFDRRPGRAGTFGRTTRTSHDAAAITEPA